MRSPGVALSLLRISRSESATLRKRIEPGSATFLVKVKSHREEPTVRHGEIGTSISEPSKRVPIFPHDVRGCKQVNSYFRQRNWVQARKVRTGLDPAPCRLT